MLGVVGRVCGVPPVPEPDPVLVPAGVFVVGDATFEPSVPRQSAKKATIRMAPTTNA